MTDGIKEFSKEEATSLIYYGPPTSVAPVQQAAPAPAAAAPAAPSAAPSTSPRLTPPRAGKPSASIQDPGALVEQVLAARRRLEEETPAPQPPSAISGLVDQVTSNWMPLAVGAGAMYALTRGPSDVKRTYEAGKRLMTRSAPLDESTKIDPTFANDTEMRQAELDAQKPKPALTPFENLQQRAADLTASVQGKPIPAPGMALQPIAPTLPGAVGNAPAGIPSVQQPFTAAPQPMVETAVATGGNVNQAIQQTVAQEIDKPVDVAPETTSETPKKKIKGAAGPAVSAPEGYIPAYPNPKRNKRAGDVFGQGGFHWLTSQEGPDAAKVWRDLIGSQNASYDTAKEKYVDMMMSGGEPGKFPPTEVETRRQKYVPDYIKGNASRGMMGTLASLGLLGVAGSEKGREAMSRAANAIKDLGVSPDIFAGKGEELGNLGRAYVNAGNPAYAREIIVQLNTEKDPARRALLQEELQKIGGSGSGRGIAPPSAYMR